MNESQIKDDVWQTIRSLNRVWTVEGNAEKLKDYFHKSMVAITPTDRLRREGRDSCIAGWKAFMDTAKIHYWKEVDPKIDIYGDGKFAVVTYYFDMSFDMNGETITMGGRDMLALVHEDGRWQVVADQFSPYPRQ